MDTHTTGMTTEASPKALKPTLDKAEQQRPRPVSVHVVPPLDLGGDGEPVLNPNIVVVPFLPDPDHVVVALPEGNGNNNQGNGTSHGECLCLLCTCCDYCRQGNSAVIRRCDCTPRDANLPTECACCAACKCLTVLKPEVVPDPPPQLLQPILV